MASRSQNQIIPETPEDEINISGTTILPSEPDTDLDPEMMIDVLPGLARAAEDMLEFLVPSSAELATIVNLGKVLSDPRNTQSKRLGRHVSNLRREAEYFGHQTYIDVELVNHLFASSETVAEKLQGLEHQWNPDPFLQKANCAQFALEVLLARPGTNTSPKQAIRILDGVFPLPFMNNLVSESQKQAAGDSSLEKETFDLALELRTQYMIMRLEEEYRRDPDCDPVMVLDDGFYIELETDDDASEPVQLVLRGFQTEALAGPNGEVPAKYAGDVEYRCKEMQVLCMTEDNKLDLEELKREYGWRKFVARAAQWVRKRSDEIDKDIIGLRSVRDVQNAFFARPKTRHSLGSTVSSTPRLRSSATPSTARRLTQSISGTATSRRTSAYAAAITPSLTRNGVRTVPGSVVSERIARYTATPSSLRNETHTVPETQHGERHPEWDSASPEARRSMQSESPFRSSTRPLQRTSESSVEREVHQTVASPETESQIHTETPTRLSVSNQQAESLKGSPQPDVDQQAGDLVRANSKSPEPDRSLSHSHPEPVPEVSGPESNVPGPVETPEVSNDIQSNGFKKSLPVDRERRRSFKPIFLNAASIQNLMQRKQQLNAGAEGPEAPRQSEPARSTTPSKQEQSIVEKSSEVRQPEYGQATHQSQKDNSTSEKSPEPRQPESIQAIHRLEMGDSTPEKSLEIQQPEVPRSDIPELAPEEPSETRASPDMTSTFVQDEVEFEVTEGQLDIGDPGESQLERSHSPSFVRNSRPSSLREEALQRSSRDTAKDPEDDVDEAWNMFNAGTQRSRTAPQSSRALFIDHQTNAERVSPISQGLDPRSVERRRTEVSRKRRREPDEIPESDAEFERDDREVSVERQRARKPIQPRSKRARTERRTESTAENPSNRPQERHVTPLRRSTRSSHPRVSPDQPLASSRVPSTPKPRKQRLPKIVWNEGENKRLIRLIEEFGHKRRGTSFDWNAILRENHVQPPLPGEKQIENRNNVQIKDRARNMKRDFLLKKLPLPRNFDAVTLSASHIDDLAKKGIHVSR
ncbi:uncharacterized protein BO97DRAFT_424697 [Aspergillus homomorphus CBS 101889]|uniref:Myb-like domain-containing protein n=1 Tax=Aspergillus homomorphus (strain CBS 101889) TaxID=1450537 RepID=A0A395HW78_ASPHC|nr:hypothetical protein BO97DRAFT_424697 [Aspergillus homomorphus CBS 101889]RAL12171.1 hypothetical protein BO97DRAFT_424697 [Aspergillus homomorphus CBS 101889]